MKSELVSGEGHAKIDLRKTLDEATQGTLDQQQFRIRDMHGNQGAFAEIYRQPQGVSKLIEQLLQTMGRHLISSYDNQRVIYVLKNGIGSIIK
jgi:hypothetical protein